MCNCKTEIEAQLVERFKAKHPEAADHRASLDGYGFAIVNNAMELRPFMQVKFGAGHANKKTGVERWKNEKGTMGFRFCPFCGEKVGASCTPSGGQPVENPPV